MARGTTATDRRGIDVAGPPDGQPILFLHGAMFTRAMWAPQRNALADEFRVVAPDLPGHGDRSDETFDIERALALVDDVVETECSGRAILVGLSLGGYVATAYAERHPEKVEGLIVADSSVNPVRGMGLLTRATGGVTRLLTRSDLVERAVQRLGKRWVRNRDLSPETEREIVEGGIYPHEFGTPAPDIAGRDFREALAAYPGPVLIANGEKDLLMRGGEDDHADAGGRAEVAVLDGAGHVSNLHRPEKFTDLVREFAARVAAST